MEFNEALEAAVTRAEAKREIERHHCSFAEFLAECGDRERYQGSVVLFWLGY